ncbi:adenylate kinase [Thermoflavifilum thermophilum]|uniref:Adenylate kinase n=1 Tax=Thermoflavifilum thermophilum TaxID=1393122 RepID=A0A1I7NB74_9BACT|nr:adenylate kinase [Thermoflavifilum thermophilum]SFV31915.1 Adenylate kinase [Thermoflavifilum thermophilum]
MLFNLILFGPPGSGKGTQSQLIIDHYQFTHLSTGDMLRSEIERRTPLGLEAKKFMDRGALVPDEVVIAMISSRLDASTGTKGFIFDGFPRTTAQARALDKLLALKSTAIHLVLLMEVPEEELIKRLLLRGQTSGRSDDASEEIIRTRIAEYYNKTSPVADYYAQQHKLQAIQAVGTVEEVFNRIRQQIDKRFAELTSHPVSPDQRS